MKQYDVIIIGAGPSGIFCAYELNPCKEESENFNDREGQTNRKERMSET